MHSPISLLHAHHTCMRPLSCPDPAPLRPPSCPQPGGDKSGLVEPLGVLLSELTAGGGAANVNIDVVMQKVDEVRAGRRRPGSGLLLSLPLAPAWRVVCEILGRHPPASTVSAPCNCSCPGTPTSCRHLRPDARRLCVRPRPQLADRYPFQVPPYFALILRCFSVIEGIALRVDPQYGERAARRCLLCGVAAAAGAAGARGGCLLPPLPSGAVGHIAPTGRLVAGIAVPGGVGGRMHLAAVASQCSAQGG